MADAIHDNVMFATEKLSAFKVMKSHLIQSHNKQNLSFVLISYEIQLKWQLL